MSSLAVCSCCVRRAPGVGSLLGSVRLAREVEFARPSARAASHCSSGQFWARSGPSKTQSAGTGAVARVRQPLALLCGTALCAAPGRRPGGHRLLRSPCRGESFASPPGCLAALPQLSGCTMPSATLCPNKSIEGTTSGRLRLPTVAPHLQRWAPEVRSVLRVAPSSLPAVVSLSKVANAPLPSGAALTIVVAGCPSAGGQLTPAARGAQTARPCLLGALVKPQRAALVIQPAASRGSHRL